MKYCLYYFHTRAPVPLLGIKMGALQIYNTEKSKDRESLRIQSQGRWLSHGRAAKHGPLQNCLLQIINAGLQTDFHLNPAHVIVWG